MTNDPAINRLSFEYYYNQAADSIAELIADGTYTVKLPGERQLAPELDVSYATVRRAMKILRERGLIVSIHGRGTYVRAAIPRGTRQLWTGTCGGCCAATDCPTSPRYAGCCGPRVGRAGPPVPHRACRRCAPSARQRSQRSTEAAPTYGPLSRSARTARAPENRRELGRSPR